MRVVMLLMIAVIPCWAEDEKKKDMPSVKFGDVEVRVFKFAISEPSGRPATRTMFLSFDVENKGKATVEIDPNAHGITSKSVKITTSGGRKTTAGSLGTLNAPLSELGKDGYGNRVILFKPNEKASISFGQIIVDPELQDAYAISIPGELFGRPTKAQEMKLSKEWIEKYVKDNPPK